MSDCNMHGEGLPVTRKDSSRIRDADNQPMACITKSKMKNQNTCEKFLCAAKMQRITIQFNHFLSIPL